MPRLGVLSPFALFALSVGSVDLARSIGFLLGFFHRVHQAFFQSAHEPAVPGSGHGGPASDFVFEDGVGHIGFIASISQPFCMSCNRIRITADGKLRNCLFSLDETDVRSLLRGEGTDDQIASAIRSSVATKKEGHEINTARFIQPTRPMYSIGG